MQIQQITRCVINVHSMLSTLVVDEEMIDDLSLASNVSTSILSMLRYINNNQELQQPDEVSIAELK